MTSYQDPNPWVRHTSHSPAAWLTSRSHREAGVLFTCQGSGARGLLQEEGPGDRHVSVPQGHGGGSQGGGDYPEGGREQVVVDLGACPGMQTLHLPQCGGI